MTVHFVRGTSRWQSFLKFIRDLARHVLLKVQKVVYQTFQTLMNSFSKFSVWQSYEKWIRRFNFVVSGFKNCAWNRNWNLRCMLHSTYPCYAPLITTLITRVFASVTAQLLVTEEHYVSFFPGLHGQFVSVTYPRRTAGEIARTAWPETDWPRRNIEA